MSGYAMVSLPYRVQGYSPLHKRLMEIKENMELFQIETKQEKLKEGTQE
jgi:hypothetical protein